MGQTITKEGAVWVATRICLRCKIQIPDTHPHCCCTKCQPKWERETQAEIQRLRERNLW